MRQRKKSAGYPLISIAIPTYNRASRLKEVLDNLASQPHFKKDWIEIVISDNASTDDTKQVVTNFVEKTGKPITYNVNKFNVGIDGNIHSVSRLASGKYILFMSDDDILQDGALQALNRLTVEHSDLLFCFVNGGSFSGSYHSGQKLSKIVDIENTIVSRDPNLIFSVIGIWSTFLSSFFVDRESWLGVLDPEQHIGTDIYLTHILIRMLYSNRGRTCVILADKYLAVRAEYTGSYRIFYAFAYSFMKILSIDAVEIGYEKHSLREVKIKMMRQFIPEKILIAKCGGPVHRQLKPDELMIIMRYVWWEPWAWVLIVPLSILPPRILIFLIKIKKSLAGFCLTGLSRAPLV